MKVTCPTCSATLKAAESMIGRKVKCPRCGEPLTVNDPRAAEEEFADVDVVADDEVDEDEVEAAPRKRTAARRAAKQTCPMCGAKNPAAADTCASCGEELEGGGGPRGAGLWRDGKVLVMRKDAKLPDRCVKSNEPAECWLRRKLYWHHPAVYLALLANLIIYAILAICLRKKADIQIGLSKAWYRRRLWAILITWLIFFAGGALFIYGLSFLDGPNQSLALLAPIGLIGGLVGIIISLQFVSLVTPAKITNDYLWLKGVHRDFLADLPEWEGDE